MTSQTRNIADGSGGGGASLDALHALTVDDGMLVYTKTLTTGNGTINLDVNFNSPLAEDVSAINDNTLNYDPDTGQNANLTSYDQYFFGSKDVLYYIDDDGYLVMRYKRTYTYTGPK
jgi:hypothetical protein